MASKTIYTCDLCGDVINVFGKKMDEGDPGVGFYPSDAFGNVKPSFQPLCNSGKHICACCISDVAELATGQPVTNG